MSRGVAFTICVNIIKRYLYTAVVIGILAAIGVGVAYMNRPPERDDAGALVEAGDVGVFHLRVGDCMMDPGAGEVRSASAVSCVNAHDMEAYHAFDLDHDVYPGNTAIIDLADVRCTEAFATFIGVPYETSKLYLTHLAPTSESWAKGDREVLCLVGTGDGTALTGSARGAGV